MCCSHQYLSIDQKIVSMNADILETIKDRELGSQI